MRGTKSIKIPSGTKPVSVPSGGKNSMKVPTGGVKSALYGGGTAPSKSVFSGGKKDS